MSILPKLESLKHSWPWWAMAIAFVALTFPLWAAEGLVFSEWLFKDGLNTAWIYGDVTLQLIEGHIPTHYDRFDWPCPRTRAGTPNWIDAAIVGPWALLLEWPQRWGAQMSSVIGLNAFAVAFFAWALGARGWALLYVGLMSAMVAPLWHELQAGRANGAWFGVPFATIGAYVLLARADSSTSAKRRFALFFLTALTGYLTLTIYPPYAAMLAPVGAILLVAELRKNPSATWWVLDATVVALLAALPILTVMAGHIEEYYGTAAACLGDQVWCVADDGTATVASLFRLTPDSTPSFLRFTSFSAAFWLAAPAILLSANRRRWVLCSAFALGLLFLSLGPCASWTLDSGDLNGVHASSSGWAAVWCALQRIHRPERFAMVAAGVLLTGMALGLQQASTRGVRARQVACLVAALSVLHSGWLLMGSVTQAASWKAPPEVRDSADLANQPASVIAALPFDGTYEYLAAMLQPQHYWVNSYQPERRTHTSHVAIRWLQRVGLGDLDAPTPTNADWRSAGVNAVTYSPDRCGTAVIQPISRCFYDLPATLKAALGPPTQTDGRNMMWTLQPDPGAAAARTTMCGTNGEGELEFAPAFGKRESP